MQNGTGRQMCMHALKEDEGLAPFHATHTCRQAFICSRCAVAGEVEVLMCVLPYFNRAAHAKGVLDIACSLSSAA